MSNITTFNFNSFPVRIEVKDNEPLFCLTDVATVLNIRNANPSRFNLNEDGIHKMYTVDTLERKNELTFINEPNLYRVIFRSNKEEAVKFQNWVFEEVLPTIRKTGSYTPETQQQHLHYFTKKHEVEDDILHTLFNCLFLAESQAEQLRNLEIALQGTALKLSPTAYSLHTETSFVLGLKSNGLKDLLTSLSKESAEWKSKLTRFNRLSTMSNNKPNRLAIR